MMITDDNASPFQTTKKKATFSTGRKGWMNFMNDRILCIILHAAFFSIVLFGCDPSNSREAYQMDKNIVNPSIGDNESITNSASMIPPIDLIEPSQIATATFALG
jgi:hypothetical protein